MSTEETHVRPFTGVYYIVVVAFTLLSVQVPLGVVSNGASIPKWLQFIFKPTDPRHFLAAVMHDWLYSKESHCNSRTYADYLFCKATTHHWTIKVLFFILLRLFGWRNWKKGFQNHLNTLPSKVITIKGGS